MAKNHRNQEAKAQARTQANDEKKAIVKAAEVKSKGDLQACYEDFLKREPKVDEGAVTVHWRIGHTGQPEFLKLIHSDLEDNIFEDCVLSKIQNSYFPERHGGALVAHTFNFHRKSPSHLDF